MSETRKGVLAMLGACLIWGCMPLIYKPVTHVASAEVLAHRVIWSLVFFSAVLHARGKLHDVRRTLVKPGAARTTLVAAAMISVNWFLIIFATAQGRNTEGSLGYYIYPLFAVALGAVLFGERLNGLQKISVGMASAAVVLLAIAMQAAPWIALALGLSFAWYGVLKKRGKTDAIVSVTAELLVFMPFVLIILLTLFWAERLQFGSDASVSLYLVVAGPITAFPLVLFSYAAQRISMSTTGLMQYINPTLQFLTAVVLFAEPFGMLHALAFGLIWAALALYSVSVLASANAVTR